MTNEVKLHYMLTSSPEKRQNSENELAALLDDGWLVAGFSERYVLLVRDVDEDFGVNDLVDYGARADDLRAAEKQRLYDGTNAEDDLPGPDPIPLDDRRGFSIRG